MKSTFDTLLSQATPPIGHGCALTLPDMPFLTWRFSNRIGETFERSNTDTFCAAADAMCRVLQRFRQKRGEEVDETGIGTEDVNAIRRCFRSFTDPDASVRHSRWTEALRQGRFSFGPATVNYDATGETSWAAQALGTSFGAFVAGKSSLDEGIPYPDQLLASDWTKFHYAALLHRLTVLHEILPKYGICAG